MSGIQRQSLGGKSMKSEAESRLLNLLWIHGTRHLFTIDVGFDKGEEYMYSANVQIPSLYKEKKYRKAVRWCASLNCNLYWLIRFIWIGSLDFWVDWIDLICLIDCLNGWIQYIYTDDISSGQNLISHIWFKFVWLNISLLKVWLDNWF